MEKLDIFKEARKATFGKQNISQSGTLTKLSGVAGNIAGAGVNKLSGLSKTLMAKSPQQLQDLVTKMSQSDSKVSQVYAKPLMEAANSKLKAKEALLFTLTQQPGFKQALKDIGEVSED